MQGSALAAIVLAGGSSVRMGRPKQLLPFGESTILRQVIGTFLRAGIAATYVVVGHRGEEVGAHIADLPVRVLTNPRYAEGMGASIRCGIAALDPRTDGVLIALGDHPAVRPETIRELSTRLEDSPRGILVPTFHGWRGHPVIFRRARWPALRDLRGDVGGAGILKAHPDDVLEVPVADPGIILDVDTEGDLRHAAALAARPPRECSSLCDALGLTGRGVLSIVGAGGKTSLLFALAAELVGRGHRVVTTTTTKILPPSREQSPVLLLSEGRSDLSREVSRALGESPHVSVAARLLANGKLEGIPPQHVDGLAGSGAPSHILVEADGAAGRPLKAANDTEPVIPGSSTLCVAVMGIEALGAPLDDAHVFRSALAAKVAGVTRGAPVTAEVAATLLLGPRGVLRAAPAGAGCAVFVNKVEDRGLWVGAYALGEALLAAGAGRLGRVVLGSALRPSLGLSVLER